jgi:hypothetical protein
VLADGVEARVELGADILGGRDRDARRQERVQPATDANYRNPCGRAERRHLADRVHTGVGTRGAGDPYSMSDHFGDGFLKMLLHRLTVVLALPTDEVGPVVLDDQADRSVARQDRFVPSGLPTRPCADGDECGWRPIWGRGGERFPTALQWARALSERECQMFYLVDTSPPSSNHRRLVLMTSRETMEVSALPGMPASGLERACARAVACRGAGESEGMLECIHEWLDVELASDARLASFLAATSCEEIAANNPRYRDASAPPSCTGTH